MTWESGALVLALSAVVSAACVAGVLPFLRSGGVVDVPAHRSLHSVPTPRGGGVGVLVTVVVVTGTSFLLGDVGAAGVLVLLPVVALGIVGLLDDVTSSPVGRRLLAQLAAGVVSGVVLSAATGRAVTWTLPVTLATLVLVNATNFMDGANGLLGMHGVVAGTWYLVVALVVDVPGAAVLAAAVAGASLGFLPFNSPVARVFLGDVGSYTLGAIWATLASWLLMQGAPPLAVLAPMLVPLADTGVTMVRRLLQGDSVTTPHRLHVYQRLVGARWSHLRVSGVVAATTALLALLALPALLGASPVVRMVALAASLLVCLGYLTLTVPAGEGAHWDAVRGAEAP